MQLQQPPNQVLSYSDVSKFVRSHKQLHAAMSRDGWRLPSVSSALCTLEFLDNVREGIVYCPHHRDLNSSLQCYSIPTKDILFKKLIAAFEAQYAAGRLTPRRSIQIENLVEAIKLRQADSSFYVACLSIYAPNDEVFHKSYQFKKPSKLHQEVHFNNQDSLFDNLPALSEQQIRSSNRLRVPKEKSLELKLLKAQARIKELSDYEVALQAKLLASKQGRFKFKVHGDTQMVDANAEE